MNNNEYGANLAKQTLTGDIATFLIDRLRQFPKTYREMSEKEQEEQIEMAKTAAKELVSKAVNIVASGGREVIMAELGKITVDKQIKAVVEVNSQYAEDLIAVQGKPILIVTNSDAEFTGGGEDLKADPDQREMFENANSEYQEADGEGIPDPVHEPAAALPAPEDPNVTDAEFEEVSEEDGTDFKSDENRPETGGNVENNTDSVNDEFTAEEESFDEDNPSPDAA